LLLEFDFDAGFAKFARLKIELEKTKSEALRTGAEVSMGNFLSGRNAGTHPASGQFAQQWKLCRKSSGCNVLAVDRRLRSDALTPEPLYSKVGRIPFGYQIQTVGDCDEKDYSRYPEPCGAFRPHRWNRVWIQRYGVLQEPRHALLQESGYEVLSVNATRREQP